MPRSFRGGCGLLLLVLFAALPTWSRAGAPAPAVPSEWKRLGTVQPRHAREIKSSKWSIGGECMDRDYTIYKNWREYLGPLGAKAMRIQAGWAKCEKQPGVYDWAWLDEIVDDALAQGVRPWVETSYGNPIYEGGGGTGLGGGLPKSPQALAGWDNWVRALARRYKDRIIEWEVWNEPDHQNVEDYTRLYVRTAEILRAEQPEAQIFALALAGNLKFAEAFIMKMKELGKVGLISAITVHGYPKNPDGTDTVDKMNAILAKHSLTIPVRQGETGAPSKFQPVLALSNIHWTEVTQAKYNLRRMLAHHGKDVPFSLFQMMDMHYDMQGKLQINWKGQLETKLDKTVSHAKLSYFAAQRVFTIFDDRLQVSRDFSWRSAPEMTSKTLSVFGYADAQGRQVVTVWRRDAPPKDDSGYTNTDLTFPQARFSQPVYVDMLSGNVYEIPANQVEQSGSGTRFKDIPLCDSVVLIAERDLIPVTILGSWKRLGTVQPRHAREIKSSNWSVGAECMDRDYTVYKNWREYLGPLGIKKARVQSGWAKTEKVAGQYDFAWLDEIIFDMPKQGVKPWICLCYGNPVYESKGTGKVANLGSNPATDPQTRKAWCRYVAAVVDRYKDVVDEWEIWNEPRGDFAKDYGYFLIDTAETIRARQPKATIIGFATPGIVMPLVKGGLDVLKKEGKLDLIDIVTYHPYNYNPDLVYKRVEELRRLVDSYSPRIKIFQGENGAPSQRGSYGAIAQYDWSEERQAKWALRRLLGDLGRDIPSSYFSICDMHYPDRINYKGMLKTNPDKTISHAKNSYYAVQRVAAIFDARLRRVRDFAWQAKPEPPVDDDALSVFGYSDTEGRQIVTYWKHDAPPQETEFLESNLKFPTGRFKQPVYVDMLNGGVYEIPADQIERSESGIRFKSMPVCDSVGLIAERELIPLKTEAQSASTAGPGVTLQGAVSIGWAGESRPVALAATDLAADCERVFGTPGKIVKSGPADVSLALDPALPGPEAWRIEIAAQGVRIRGSDPLGLVFGIYQFSERCLEVDPLWFWKEVLPERREKISLGERTIASTPAVFRYRGWFINDEDLLNNFREQWGRRYIRPDYERIFNPAMAERIFEGLLRLGGNLIIPASYLDIMNPPEQAMLRKAVERGLYVSQHHQEPLGMSHFGFENYTAAQGNKQVFRYASDPESVRKVWRVYAQKWREIAGDQVIWQLGLRGRTDRPAWDADPAITPDNAGKFVSQALVDQVAIIREIDPRPQPPMTATLWAEGSALMASGKLKIPAGVTIVFSDAGPRQAMQEDFRKTERLSQHQYGVYYHVGYWHAGPHLIQGVPPEHIHAVLSEIQARGDTNFAIVNVANVREHVLGAHVFIRTTMRGTDSPLASTLAEFGPYRVQELSKLFYAGLARKRMGGWMQDGDCHAVVEKFLANARKNQGKPLATKGQPYADPKELMAAAKVLDRVERAATWSEIPKRWHPFAKSCFVGQAQFLAALYRTCAVLSQPTVTAEDIEQACGYVEQALAVRPMLATGEWSEWYRGDTKEDWVGILKALRELKS